MIFTVIRNEENIEICKNEENISSNRWTIDCKYYTADINLCTSTSLKKLSDQFVHDINAIIILCNIDYVNFLIIIICICSVNNIRITVLEQYYGNYE